MDYREVTGEREFVARLEYGEDWRAQIESFAAEEGIDAAWFVAMGAVQDAELWYYDQIETEYRSVWFDEPLEVAACIGNVSWLDGSEQDSDGQPGAGADASGQHERFAHTHAVLSRRSGQTLAGHLNEATVFAGELYLRAFDEELTRTHDIETDLDLWL